MSGKTGITKKATKSLVHGRGKHVSIYSCRLKWTASKTKPKIVSQSIKSKPSNARKDGRKLITGHRTETRTKIRRGKTGRLLKSPKIKTHTARRTSRHVTRRRNK